MNKTIIAATVALAVGTTVLVKALDVDDSPRMMCQSQTGARVVQHGLMSVNECDRLLGLRAPKVWKNVTRKP